MTREIVNVNFGQFGIRCGARSWDVICKKFGFTKDYDGHLEEESVESPNAHFIEHSDGLYMPRCVFADFGNSVSDGNVTHKCVWDNDAIDWIRSDYLKNLFDSINSFASINEGSAGNNYAHGKKKAIPKWLQCFEGVIPSKVNFCYPLQASAYDINSKKATIYMPLTKWML